MKRVVIGFGGICTAFILVFTGMRVLGHFTRPALLDRFAPEACTPHPCWNGLAPGRTSVQQAREVLIAASPANAAPTSNYHYVVCEPNDKACWDVAIAGISARAADPLAEVKLIPPAGKLTLGDLVLLYGAPTSATICWQTAPSSTDVTKGVPRPLMIGYVIFKGHVRVNVYNPRDLRAARFDPAMMVDQITYKTQPDLTIPAWQGFMPVDKLGCGRGGNVVVSQKP
jgi:hypothetical protein